MSGATKTLSFKGWRVELDRAQVIPSDPGAGTPALVYAPSGASGTYWCVCDTGEIDCGSEDVPPNVARWLDDIRDSVEEFLA